MRKDPNSHYFWAVKAQRKIKGETYRSKWFKLSSALYLGARNSSPQVLLIIPFCKLDPNLVLPGQKM